MMTETIPSLVNTEKPAIAESRFYEAGDEFITPELPG